ncbi:MAG TPA: aminoacyl-tRNA hydrolase [Deltaproteobacteria bacterium]|nr:aminoacyl-tRNA hydrolase [Deltaproteobacteria bacterium]
MGQQRLRMVVGLGNPGETYSRSRHNTGFMIVDALAEAYTIPLNKTKYDTVFGRGPIEGLDVLLAKPMAYMNRSGFPVQRLAHYFRILREDLLVVHDDIDLAIGRLKIKEKGGDAGHKGIRSMMNAFGGGDFTRLRVGIGRSESDTSVSDHVLGTFHTEEKEIMDIIIKRAKDAVVTTLSKGIAEGMNRFNNTTITT